LRQGLAIRQDFQITDWGLEGRRLIKEICEGAIEAVMGVKITIITLTAITAFF